jgi:hypothetical protein
LITLVYDSPESNRAEDSRVILVQPQWIIECHKMKKFIMPGRFYPKQNFSEKPVPKNGSEMEIEELKDTEDPIHPKPSNSLSALDGVFESDTATTEQRLNSPAKSLKRSFQLDFDDDFIDRTSAFIN